MTTILTTNLEDYLEAIYQIAAENHVARSMEIADRLKVKRSSVTVALRSLADKGLINYQVRSYVTLTEEGAKVARCVVKRHTILNNVFTKILGLDTDESDKAACAMEHGMTSEVCRKMTALLRAHEDSEALAAELSKKVRTSLKQIDCEKAGGCDATPTHEPELYDLNVFKPGEQGIIAKITGSGALAKRLREMGITRGQKMSVVRAAPLDDPIQVKVRNFNLSLRREEAGLILLERTRE